MQSCREKKISTGQCWMSYAPGKERKKEFVVLMNNDHFVLNRTSFSLCLIRGKSFVHFDGGRDTWEEGRVEASEGHFQVGQDGEASNRFG